MSFHFRWVCRDGSSYAIECIWLGLTNPHGHWGALGLAFPRSSVHYWHGHLHTKKLRSREPGNLENDDINDRDNRRTAGGSIFENFEAVSLTLAEPSCLWCASYSINCLVIIASPLGSCNYPWGTQEPWYHVETNEWLQGQRHGASVHDIWR